MSFLNSVIKRSMNIIFNSIQQRKGYNTQEVYPRHAFPVLLLKETYFETFMAWLYINIQEAYKQQPNMNYVPGTASLIDDIDSKLEQMGTTLQKIVPNVTSCDWHTCIRLIFVVLSFALTVSCREAPGPAPRWQNTDRLPQKHRSIRYSWFNEVTLVFTPKRRETEAFSANYSEAQIFMPSPYDPKLLIFLSCSSSPLQPI